MTLVDPLQLPRDQRAALLACEAIGWLHMAGKAHPDFVRQQAQSAQTNGWDELTWASSFYEKLANLPGLAGQSIEPKKLFEEHRESDDGVLGLLQAAHAMASGIEKNNPGDYQKQAAAEVWLTTAFGHPVCRLLQNPPQVGGEHAWNELKNKIGALVGDLVQRIKDKDNVEEWRDWRDRAIGPAGWLREAFTSTLAETRVPNNDVTLWDQSSIAAALFKAAAAGAVLSGDDFEWGQRSKANTRWRVLTVGIGAEHYEARAVHIGDWTGARGEIEALFDEVCGFVEIDLALGACVYRDERTLAFTFPGQRLDGRGSVSCELASDLRARIEARVDELAQSRAFETPPLVRLSASTRSFIAMSQELAAARRLLEVPVHRTWSIAPDGSTGQHVCPVSLVRRGHPPPNTQTDGKQNASKSCYERRTGRREAWEKQGGDTIWISEVADGNGRVALLTFGLGIDGWLDGTHIDSLRAHSVVEWRKNNPTSTTIDEASARDSLRRHIEAFVRSPTHQNGNLSDVVLSRLNPGFKHETKLETFFEKIVEDRARAPAWENLDDAKRAEWLLHQLFRKNASPGRIHRFWRTTRAFFSEALDELRQVVSSGSDVRHQRLRLEISGDMAEVRPGDVYAGHLPIAPDAPFEILRRKNDFVTVCNLARALGPDGARLDGQSFSAKGDDGIRRQFTIKSVANEEAPLQSYHPLIVLEQNPERFRVLVPLAEADACVGHVVDKWRSEMARVWDRLPLHAGVIAFPRKTPFQAVIEAARNVEDELGRRAAESWRVTRVKKESATTELCFERPDGGPESVKVETRLRGGADDVYYPNVAIIGEEREPHDFTVPRSEGESTVYRWAPELKSSDEVCVDPSRFAMVFLDSTARRFEPVQVHSLSEWNRRRELWDLVRKSKPSFTSVWTIEQSLREAREHWTDEAGALDQAAWEHWVRAVLANEWNAAPDEVQKMEEAGRDGLLERVLSWHLHVLKENPGVNQ